MAQKRLNDPSQLDLFAHAQPERTPQLRPDGGNPLVPALSPDGAATDAAGAAASGALGRPGADDGRNGNPDKILPPTGTEPPGARSSVGAGEGEIHSPPAGAGEGVPLNAGNYRITDTDRIGEGGLKQMYRQNLAAIRAVRPIQAEARPATTEEKAVPSALGPARSWSSADSQLDSIRSAKTSRLPADRLASGDGGRIRIDV